MYSIYYYNITLSVQYFLKFSYSSSNLFGVHIILSLASFLLTFTHLIPLFITSPYLFFGPPLPLFLPTLIPSISHTDSDEKRLQNIP